MREIKTGTWTCQALDRAFDASDAELRAWLAAQTAYRFGLAHADDGVIWGRFESGAWRWSTGVVGNSPHLRAATLQEIRLFGASGELFAWRSETVFSGRMITDGAGEPVSFFDETRLLWGTHNDAPDAAQEGFQARRHGAEGLRHAPPAEIAAAGSLTVRNYVVDDDSGFARVVASRLTFKE